MTGVSRLPAEFLPESNISFKDITQDEDSYSVNHMENGEEVSSHGMSRDDVCNPALEIPIEKIQNDIDSYSVKSLEGDDDFKLWRGISRDGTCGSKFLTSNKSSDDSFYPIEYLEDDQDLKLCTPRKEINEPEYMKNISNNSNSCRSIVFEEIVSQEDDSWCSQFSKITNVNNSYQDKNLSATAAKIFELEQ
ncbi:uncharacterized protein LOC129726646 [Wyeomyia smithii]|uniref:uncharacterized protein LOC129726646 n=1 Tax=Wyeomyia smithii TaxID=174621 RepID=UPI0024680DD6|nr:uncharacterized protein LOC129726646 [Wyeomyia smithii]